MKKIILAFGLLIISSVAFLPSSEAAKTLDSYSDKAIVPVWAKRAFDSLLKSEIIKGNDDGTLKANHHINRAEFSKILIKATEQKLITPQTPTFKDVQPGQWFYPYIETAYSLGWVKGYGDGTFRPGNDINRAEVAKLLAKSFILNANIEGNTGEWYTPYIETLENRGILPFNVKASEFNAGIKPTRAEVFEQIYRAIRADRNYITDEQKNPGMIKVPIKSSNEDPYDIAGNFTIKMAVTDDAGTLDMKRPDNQARRIEVDKGQKGVNVFSIELVARKSNIELSEIQLRRIGFGEIDDFSNLWVEMNGEKISNSISPSEDIVTFKFLKSQSLPKDGLKVLRLNADISPSAESGHSHRFVLFLPDWINANTNAKIGLFPFGGSDIAIR